MSAVLEKQFDLLTQELQLIDGAIRQHDEIPKGIKNWAIVTWTASIGVCLSQEGLTDFLWVTTFSPVLFWLVDATFRRIQRTFITRSQEISAFINSQEFREALLDGNPLQFDLLTLRVHPEDWEKQWLQTLFFRSIWLLYFGLIGLSLFIWIAVKFL